MQSCGFFRASGAQWERLLPPLLRPEGPEALPGRCWEVLVLTRSGAAELSRAEQPPRCRTLVLSQDVWRGGLQARQVVGCGLSRRCSLTLSSLTPQPVLCVQRQLTAADGRVIEPQELPLPARWQHLPPEPLLLLVAALLLGHWPEQPDAMQRP